jgi:hypothetical protein
LHSAHRTWVWLAGRFLYIRGAFSLRCGLIAYHVVREPSCLAGSHLLSRDRIDSPRKGSPIPNRQACIGCKTALASSSAPLLSWDAGLAIARMCSLTGGSVCAKAPPQVIPGARRPLLALKGRLCKFDLRRIDIGRTRACWASPEDVAVPTSPSLRIKAASKLAPVATASTPATCTWSYLDLEEDSRRIGHVHRGAVRHVRQHDVGVRHCRQDERLATGAGEGSRRR